MTSRKIIALRLPKNEIFNNPIGATRIIDGIGSGEKVTYSNLDGKFKSHLPQFQAFLNELGSYIQTKDGLDLVLSTFADNGDTSLIKASDIKSIDIDYKVSASEKHVFKLVISFREGSEIKLPKTKDGKLEIAVAAKTLRGRNRQFIEDEIEGLVRIKDSGVIPKFLGQGVMSLGGISFYMEEWINGSTITDHVKSGQDYGAKHVQEITRMFIKTSLELSKIEDANDPLKFTLPEEKRDYHFIRDMNSDNIMFRGEHDSFEKGLVVVDIGLTLGLEHFNERDVIQSIKEFYVLGIGDNAMPGASAVKVDDKSIKPICQGIVDAYKDVLGEKKGSLMAKEFLVAAHEIGVMSNRDLNTIVEVLQENGFKENIPQMRDETPVKIDIQKPKRNILQRLFGRN